MGKFTKSIPHLSKEEIQERIKTTVGFWRVQKWLVIWNALVDPRPARELHNTPGLQSSRFTIWFLDITAWGLRPLRGRGRADGAVPI